MKIYHTLMTWLVLALAAMTVASCSDDDDEAAMRYPAPTITGFSPSEGLPTRIVTITGTEFGSSRTERIGRVYFGGVEATEYVSWSDNEIQVRVPEGGETGPITLWVWKNHTETAEAFTCLDGARITEVSSDFVSTGEEFRAYGENFSYFIGQGLTIDDITVTFAAAEGTVEGTVTAFTEEYLDILVPSGARGGTFTVQFGDLQIVTGPSINISGYFNYYFTHLDVEEMQGACNPCSYTDVLGGGTCFYDKGVYVDGFNDQSPVGSFTLWDNVSGDYCTFRVNVLEEDDYYIYFGTKGNATGNLTISAGSDLANLSQSLTRECSASGYNWPAEEYEFSIFHLQPGTNYIRFDFGASLSLTDIHITNERVTGDNIIVGEETIQGLYACDFNEGTSYAPFTDAWAYDPCYIKTVDQCLEFYYNAAALQAENIRQRRGCEVTCEFHTTTEGWYGFRVYLPEGKFPMDEGGIIIAQIFNQGCRNSWAGHLSIENGTLVLSHRNALVDPVVGTVGQLETNRWYPIVVHFKAGLNNKGHLRAWIGDDMVESSPAYDSGDCNFGFGHWIDDETLDDTGTNEECLAYSSYGGNDALGCKFGLYVSNTVDITIRFDDIKALEGNPTGAFDIVKPIA